MCKLFLVGPNMEKLDTQPSEYQLVLTSELEKLKRESLIEINGFYYKLKNIDYSRECLGLITAQLDDDDPNNKIIDDLLKEKEVDDRDVSECQFLNNQLNHNEIVDPKWMNNSIIDLYISKTLNTIVLNDKLWKVVSIAYNPEYNSENGTSQYSEYVFIVTEM